MSIHPVSVELQNEMPWEASQGILLCPCFGKGGNENIPIFYPVRGCLLVDRMRGRERKSERFSAMMTPTTTSKTTRNCHEIE